MTAPSGDGRDPADYGPATPDGAEPETTFCRTCGYLAIHHDAGRFSIYGTCPRVCGYCGSRGCDADCDEAFEAAAPTDEVERPYLPFDRDDRLPPPPWKPTDPALIAWETAHGHDVRLKCYPEFGCLVADPANLREEIAALAARLAAAEAALRRIEQIASQVPEADDKAAWLAIGQIQGLALRAALGPEATQ